MIQIVKRWINRKFQWLYADAHLSPKRISTHSYKVAKAIQQWVTRRALTEISGLTMSSSRLAYKWSKRSLERVWSKCLVSYNPSKIKIATKIRLIWSSSTTCLTLHLPRHKRGKSRGRKRGVRLIKARALQTVWVHNRSHWVLKISRASRQLMANIQMRTWLGRRQKMTTLQWKWKKRKDKLK